MSWKANWIGHILLRKRFLKHVMEEKIEGSIEVKGTRGRGGEELLDFKQMTGYWEIEEGAVSGILWRTHFVIGDGLRNWAN